MKRLKTISLYNCLIILSLIISIVSIIRTNNIRYTKINTNIIGTILDYNKKNDKLNLIIKSNGKKILCSYYKNDYFNNIKYGAIINVKVEETNLSTNEIPNTFNYKKYLKSININNTCNILKFNNIKQSDNIVYTIKNTINKKISKYDKKGYMQTFILSNKTYLDRDTYNNYKQLGILHLFSISGMHISLLALILLTILNKINKSKINIIIVILFLLFYMKITNYSPSIVRSTILYILINIKNLLKIKIETKSIILITINLILLINANFIINIGFLYSSIISFTLIRFKNIFNKSYIKNIILISIISILVSLPITINNNYEINILSIISNVIFVPFIAFIIYPLSLITLLIPYIYPIFCLFTSLLEIICLYLSKINLFIIEIPHLNKYIIIIYYIFLYLMITRNKKYYILLLTLLIVNKYYYLIDNNYYVYFLSVGQGDMSLIKHKDECIVIDTGPKNKNIGNNILIFLKSLGIQNIDTMIITHGDSDHIGNAIFLVGNIKVDKVILNRGPYNKLEKELINILNQKKINYYKKIKEISIKNNKLYFLNTSIYNNENDNSNVIYFIYNNNKFLLMGDAGKERERDIINKYNINNIDFIKIGHHGSDTSSSKHFINKITPKNCIISVGKNNIYGHPKKSVLNNLKKCNIYRTDKIGSMKIIINKRTIFKISP